MADGSLIFDTKLDSSGIAKGLGTIKNTATKAFGVAAKSITAVSGALTAGATAGVLYNSSIENYTTSFEVMTGSADKANDVVEKLKKIGASTPFELTGLADTTQLLMNYGFTADEAIDRMTMLGDISQGSADKMNRIATAYGQMSSAGKVSLEDVKQMIEAGFNPLQEISQTTGESMESLYDRISKGTISVDEITASMQRSTSEGGKYFQSMEKQSQTFSGQISTLKDNAQMLLGEVIQPISDSLVNTLLPAAISSIEELTTAFETDGVEGLMQAGMSILTNILLGIAEALPSVIETASGVIASFIASITENLPQILSAGGQILYSLISGISLIIPELWNLGVEIIAQLLNSLVANAPQIIIQGQTMFSNFCSLIQNRLPELIDVGCQMIGNLLNGLLNNAPTIIAQAGKMLQEFIGAILSAFPQIIESGGNMVVSLVQGLISNAPQIISQARTMISNFGKEIASHLPDILQKGIELIGKLAAGIIRGIPDLLASIPGIIADLGAAFLDMDWLGIGGNIISGIATGITDAIGGLVDAAIDAAGDLFNGVCDFFGIHSPSRKFKWVGEMCTEGMDESFEDYNPYSTIKHSMKINAGTISKDFVNGVGFDNQITGNVKNTLGNIKTNIQGIGGSGNYITNDNKQTINIYQPVKTPSETARAIRLEQQYGLAGV